MTPQFSRRLFLGGMASLAVAATVKTSATIPTLWGDLIHDDAPALNALFRGDPIRVLGGHARQGDYPALIGAKLLVSEPVVIRSDYALVEGCKVVAAPGFRGDVMWLQSRCSTIRNTHVDARQGSPVSAAFLVGA